MIKHDVVVFNKEVNYASESVGTFAIYSYFKR